MASLGPFQFTAFKDEPQLRNATPRATTIEAENGVDGKIVIFGGYSVESFTLRTQATVTGGQSAATALAKQYESWIEKTTFLRDQFGRTWNNVLVVGCMPSIYATETSGLFRVVCIWRVELEVVRP